MRQTEIPRHVRPKNPDSPKHSSMRFQSLITLLSACRGCVSSKAVTARPVQQQAEQRQQAR